MPKAFDYFHESFRMIQRKIWMKWIKGVAFAILLSSFPWGMVTMLTQKYYGKTKPAPCLTTECRRK